MNNHKYCLTGGLLAGLILLTAGIPVSAGGEGASCVLQAYELRMSGQADAACAMLDEYVAEHPEDAAAWFELSRARHHAGLSQPRQLMERLDALSEASHNAMELEPDNPVYAYYNAYTTMFCAYPSLMRDQPDAGEKVQRAIEAYEAVLAIKPDCAPSLLTLTEIQAFMQPGKGGDRAKAEACAARLERSVSQKSILRYNKSLRLRQNRPLP